MHIDWSAPWLAPYAARGHELHRRMAAGASVCDALNGAMHETIALAHGPLRFVPPTELPSREAYEAFIHRTACVPTRDNLHDFFNGLMWLHWPALKRQLNALQAQAIAAAGAVATRGALRDALTLFDENGAWLEAPPDLVQALREHRWHDAFVQQRTAWRRDACVTLFGHALLEKLVAPYTAITAHAWPGALPLSLAAAHFMPKPFVPLPVLGVPGWWPASEDAAFYDDAAVFRPRRTAKP
jgi:hypothetical protein